MLTVFDDDRVSQDDSLGFLRVDLPAELDGFSRDYEQRLHAPNGDTDVACGVLRFSLSCTVYDRQAGGGAAGLKWRRPFHRTAPHRPLCLLWRLRAGLSNPTLPPGGSDPKEAAWKAAGQGPQKDPSPF